MDSTLPLTDQERKRIVTEVAELQAAESLPNTQVARIIGCSPSVWSQVRAGKYKGDTEEYLRRARQWLGRRQLRHEEPETTFVQTSIARYILTVCRRATDMPTIGMVMTRSGAGKTAALLEFRKREGGNCIYISAGQCMSSRSALLAEIATKLDLSLLPTTAAALAYREVRSRLADMYAGGSGAQATILIDEATTLRPDAINTLRNLHDDPACRPGIVLADTWRMDGELRSRRRDVMAGGYEQLTSRAGAQYRMATDAQIRQADVTLVADAILKGLGHTRRLAVSSYKYLCKIAQRPGALRNVQHRLQAVHDVAAHTGAGDKATYSVTELDFVASMLGSECELPHSASPFAQAAPARRRKAAG